MQVTSYGLFWRESEINWEPGRGIRKKFCLWGRIGSNRGTIRVADFRTQQGIYILYDEYGPSYVGLTRKLGLGARLKEHRTDHLREKWDRFSWFGFLPVLSKTNLNGVQEIGSPQSDVTEDTATTIGDLEALLIRAIGPKRNTAKMNFKNAERWNQIEDENVDQFLNRLILSKIAKRTQA